MTAEAATLPGVGDDAKTARARQRKAAAAQRRFRRPGADSLGLFFRSFATMVRAGITIDRALRVLARSSEDRVLAFVSDIMAGYLTKGQALSACLEEFPDVFSSVHVGLVKLGEQSGRLDEILGAIANYEEKRNALTLKVKSALTYPCFIMAVCLVGAILAPPYILEGHFKMIKDSAVDPPALTVLVMSVCDLLRNPVFYLAVALGLGVGLPRLRSWAQSEAGQVSLTQRVLKVPHLGRMVRNLLVSRFCRALGLQVQSGIPMDAALHYSSLAAGNLLLEQGVARSIQALREGAGLVDCLRCADFFPKPMLEVLVVGEEVGQVDRMSHWMADFYEQEVELSLETVTAALEPLIMAFMGALVGILVLATMLPMGKLLQSL